MSFLSWARRGGCGLGRCGILFTVAVIISGGIAVLISFFQIKPSKLDVVVDEAVADSYNLTHDDNLSATLSFSVQVVNPDRRLFVYFEYLELRSDLFNDSVSDKHLGLNLVYEDFEEEVQEKPIWMLSLAKDLRNQSGKFNLDLGGYIQFRSKAQLWKSRVQSAYFKCPNVSFSLSPKKPDRFGSVCSVHF